MMPADPHAALQKALSRRNAAGRTFRQRNPRHPAEVTSDRLLEALEKWPDKFDGGDRDMLSHVRFILQQIADGER